MRVAITGATGFVGRAVCTRRLERGDAFRLPTADAARADLPSGKG